ncbi:MAG: hypothetical protein P1S60_05780 [Anaerolineae bacterium]|nr:hypothetical protein [Anaerolineae bacterium]
MCPGQPQWAGYALLVFVEQVGRELLAGQFLGLFANWFSGNHLHLDMALDADVVEEIKRRG